MKKTKKYVLTVAFTVEPETDEHLQSEQAIRDEIASWLESLNATAITVHLEGKTK